jgi:hypothetical protein
MNIYPGWPYAVKAVIQHEFETDHLNIWITFRDSMDIEDPITHVPIKPPDSLWLVYVDTLLKAVSSSAWQDHWTLLLTVPDVGSLPNRVLVKYDGPHPDLRISWHKQWEPWGPILSLDVTT